MKRSPVLCLCLVLVGTLLSEASAKPGPADVAVQVFWEKFKSAVILGDKETVANLSQFPIAMPYGYKNIKTKAQLLSRWRDVFNSQTNAAKCFSKAKPTTDKATPKEFDVWCKDAGGQEVVGYHFSLTRTGWKFVGLDNINE